MPRKSRAKPKPLPARPTPLPTDPQPQSNQPPTPKTTSTGLTLTPSTLTSYTLLNSPQDPYRNQGSLIRHYDLVDLPANYPLTSLDGITIRTLGSPLHPSPLSISSPSSQVEYVLYFRWGACEWVFTCSSSSTDPETVFTAFKVIEWNEPALLFDFIDLKMCWVMGSNFTPWIYWEVERVDLGVKSGGFGRPREGWWKSGDGRNTLGLEMGLQGTGEVERVVLDREEEEWLGEMKEGLRGVGRAVEIGVWVDKDEKGKGKERAT